MADFQTLWKTISPEVSRTYKLLWNTDQDIPNGTQLTKIKIGKDVPDSPLGYMLSIEYDQDENVDVWVMGSVVTKVDFWM